MGRTEKSQGLAPPAVRKDIRAKQARHIINKVVPSILASNTRARRGADSSELLTDPGPASSKDIKESLHGGEDAAYIKRKGQGRRKAKESPDIHNEDPVPPKGRGKKSGKRRNDSVDDSLSALTLNHSGPTLPPPHKLRTVKVITTDSLTAAKALGSSFIPAKKSPNVCVLNMASPLRPGGGVLLGATSQEEFLCARTTLLPSLKESFYRLPELGCVFTRDVLVFRGPEPLGDASGELGSTERFYVDVISAGMLRFPDLEGEEGEVKRLSRKDRGIVEAKMRAVLRIAEAKGCRKLILGAWGCGAYGNPIADVAEAWRTVLAGKETSAKRGPMVVESWPGVEEVQFAILNVKMAREFAEALGDVEIEDGSRDFGEDGEEEDEEEDEVAQELQAKIAEMENQIGQVWNPDLKKRLGSVLEGLKEQLKNRQGEENSSQRGGLGTSEDDDILDEQDELIRVIQDDSDVGAEELDSDSDDLHSGIAIKS